MKPSVRPRLSTGTVGNPPRPNYPWGLEMTKDEAKAWLEKLGVKVSEITDEMLANIDAAKAQMDTDTRRKVRAFWLGVTALGVVVGVGIGTLL